MEKWLASLDQYYDGAQDLHQPWRSLRRKAEVRATRGAGALDTATDSSSDLYSALADDSSVSREEREAAMLFSVAEGHLEEDEDAASALKVAEEALALFRKAGQMRGVADVLRIIIRARVLRGDRRKALLLAREEMREFQAADDRRGEAAMMLAVAEVLLEEVGSKSREDALKSATDARTLLRQVKDKKLEAAACLVLSDVYTRRAERMLDEKAQFQNAHDAAKDAGALFRDLGEKRGEARALHALAIACGNLGKLQDTVQNAKRALALFQDLGERRSEANTMCLIAQCYLMNQSVQEALPEAKQALEIFQGLGGKTAWEMSALEVLFQAHVMDNDMDQALLVAEEGLERFQEAGDRQTEVAAWFMIYRAHLMNDHLLQARNAATNAEAILMELGDKLSQANLYLAAIELYFRRQQPDKLLQAALWAVRLFEQLEGAGHEQANAQLILMDVHLARGEVQEALLAATRAKELAVKDGDRKVEALALLTSSNIHSIAEQHPEALEVAEEARAIFRENGSVKGEAKALHLMAKIQVDSKNLQAAIDAARQARVLAQDLGDRASVVQLLILTADAELVLRHEDPAAAKRSAKDKDKALEAAKEAVALAKKVADDLLVVDALYMLAQTHLVSMKLDEGMKVVKEGVALCQESELEGQEGRMMVLAAWAHFLGNNLDAGQEAAGQALELIQRAGGDPNGEALAHEILGYISEKKAGPKQAFIAPEDFVGGGEEEGAAESQVAEVQEYQGPTVEVLARKLHVMVKDMFDVDELENDTMLMDIGIDSLSMLDFQARIAREFPGVTWSPTMLFDYPTLQELGEFMHEALENAFNKKR